MAERILSSKKINVVLLFLCLTLGQGCSCKVKEKIFLNEKPNVLLIVVDDLGWADCGFMGSTFYETPNLDHLASESLVFTNAYAGAANCAPSRAALMSGMNSPRTGIYTVSPSERGNKKSRKLIPIENKDVLADSVYTMAEMFRDAGYVTGHFGKWHLGKDPLTQGFDVNIAGGLKGHPKAYFAPYGYPDLEAPEGEYLTDRLANEAITFIENNVHKPFFLYMPFYTVHTPIQGKEAIIQKYKKKSPTNTHYIAEYAAMIESMDYNVGRLLDKLNALNLENTIVVFTSDNGGIYAISKQLPLRAGKGSYYEGGIRVPLAVKWSNKIKPRKSIVPVSNLDLYPTFSSILGTTVPENKILDGVDLKDYLIKGEQIQERALFFHFPIYLQAYSKQSGVNRDPLFRTRPGSVIIDGDWKLIWYYEDQEGELFNIKKDIGESLNLIKVHPEKTKEMKQKLEQWLQETNAPIPTTLNPLFDSEWQQKQINKYRN